MDIDYIPMNEVLEQEILNIMYLGALSTPESTNSILCFYKKGYNITPVNTRFDKFYEEVPDLAKFGIHLKVSNLYEWRGFVSYLKRRVLRYLKMIGTFNISGRYYDRETAARLHKALVENDIDLVFAEWGLGVVPEIVLLNSLNIDIPIVHNMLTYPNTTNKVKAWLADYLYANVIEGIDGLIVPIHEMKEYMIQRFNSRLESRFPRIVVYFQKYCCNYFYNHRLIRLSSSDKEPHLVFIGRTDFSRKRSHDDVRHLLRKIAKEKVHIHYQKSTSMTADSEYLHPYEGFHGLELLEGKLATYMTQFDACIVLYNVTKKVKRFKYSLPSRFLFALTAGIPIVVPKGLLPGCEEFIKRYELGFSYESYQELRDKLGDKQYMKHYSESLFLSKRFIYEENFDLLSRFFRDLVAQNGR